MSHVTFGWEKHIGVCVCVFMCVCIYVCVYMYVYIYICVCVCIWCNMDYPVCGMTHIKYKLMLINKE